MAISDFDRHHVPQILAAQDGRDWDWFSARLLRLISHADAENRERIRLTFPEHVEAFEDWYYSRGPYASVKEVV